ncbi:MAG: DUF4430 domain-containing protein [Candidatus Aenigmarchaeota archaeon]|nr:DUF4430 domain-containing protein [Candidatus Aenigmarchaeota archaeon]
MSIPQEQAKGKIRTSLYIDYGGRTTREEKVINNQTTVFQLLNETHSVNYKEYSTGYFIVSIDGVEQNGTYSWLYFVNGKPPMVSVDKYHLSNNDVVVFKFLSNNEAMKYFK